AWRGAEDTPVRAKGHPHRGAGRQERAGATEAAGVRRPKRAAQTSAGEEGGRRPTRGADKPRRSEAPRTRPPRTGPAAAERCDHSTASTRQRTAARKGRAPSSAATDATNIVSAAEA